VLGGPGSGKTFLVDCGPFDGVNVFVVDEISMLSESFLSHIADRLRQISSTNKTSTFGKFLFVACGDFQQLPPPKASSIYESVVKKYIFEQGQVFLFIYFLLAFFFSMYVNLRYS